MFENLVNNYDLSLGDWGPYTKKYMGISHVSDSDRGIRFDLSVYSSLYRRKTDIPNVIWESGFHLWEASADLSYYSFRQELLWKDQLYTDISFSKMEENKYLIACDIVNNTNKRQNTVLNYMAYIAYPGAIWKTFEELEGYSVNIKKGTWICGTDYKDFSYNTKRPKDNLVSDGYKRGQLIENGFVDSTGIEMGDEIGDRVKYCIDINEDLLEGKFIIRYRLKNNEKSKLEIEGLVNEKITLTGNGTFDTFELEIGEVKEGNYELCLTTLSENPIAIDGIAIFEGDCFFEKIENNHVPQIVYSEDKNSFILKYDNIDQYYGVSWQNDDYEIRQIYNSELDSFMRYFTHNHVDSVLMGDKKGHYTNAFMKPITVEKEEHKRIYGLVTSGTLEEVKESISSFNKKSDYSKIYENSKKQTYKFETTSEGEKYRFSQDIMAATTLTNVVYPIYSKEQYIKHNTPGRWWDCLYTWDSGFCGIGLAQFDKTRAIECLNAYVTEVGDSQSAFIHHGSMVPVQFYLMQEIWNIDQDIEVLKFFYPRLKQYYDFYSGVKGSSSMRNLETNLIRTFDYFYNSGGWDDYPAQVETHKKEIAKTTAPVVNTAHCIRIAKIMSLFAKLVGEEKDIDTYNLDIDLMTKDLYEYSYDKESGYFGYVCHDENRKPVDILRTEDGVNFNMGLDGIYPLVSGICTKEIENDFVNRLMDEERYFTKIGLTTVDKKAPYYSKLGYWNGAVWMPHQYFIWKTMLDLGRPKEAFKIAKCGLETWKSEVDFSYNCFEHFIVDSGRGAGWHHFGGLSTPVTVWFKAYFEMGMVTTGFSSMVLEKKAKEDYSEMEIKIFREESDESTTVIVCMNPDYEYQVEVNSKNVEFSENVSGCLNIPIGIEESAQIININIYKKY